MPQRSKSYWWRDKRGNWHYHKPGTAPARNATETSSTKPNTVGPTDVQIASAPQGPATASPIRGQLDSAHDKPDSPPRPGAPVKDTGRGGKTTHLGTTSVDKTVMNTSGKGGVTYKRGTYNRRHEHGELTAEARKRGKGLGTLSLKQRIAAKKAAARSPQRKGMKQISQIKTRPGVNRTQADVKNVGTRVPLANSGKSAKPVKTQPGTTPGVTRPSPTLPTRNAKGVSYNRASGRLLNKRKKGYRP